MPRIRDIVIAVAVVVIAVVVTDHCHQGNIEQWEQRVETLQRAHEATRTRALDLLEAERARADSAEARAQRLRVQEPIIRERIDSVRVHTPVELQDEPAIVQRDSIIDGLIRQRDQWKALYEEEHTANKRLRRALDNAVADADSLSAVLDDRPGDRPWFIPRLGLGPGAGITFDGDPYAGVGVHISWSISL